MSIENGTRLVRSNLIRAPLGWTVNASPAAGAPLTSTSSRPSSPFATSVPSPLFHTSVSSPAAAVHRVAAAVADDAVVAAAAAQDVVALAAEDQVRPVGAVDRVHAGAAVDGQQRERAHAGARRERVVAAEPVHLEALGRGVERELDQVRALELDAARLGLERERVAERGVRR